MMKLRVVVAVLLLSMSAQGGGIVVDHLCTDITQIPQYWIEHAKTSVVFHYGHTSHGSQLTTGLGVLESQDTNYNVAIGDSYLPAVTGAVCIYRGREGDTYIEPGDYWEGQAGLEYTMRVLSNNPSIRYSMWAWCGQAGYYTSDQIVLYLTNLNWLRQVFTNVTFIYMTGHLDGTGSGGTLHRQNNMIRDYCRANDKVLYDFGDIGRYDPDGTDYLDLGGGVGAEADECSYNGGANNWGTEWCAAHAGTNLCDSCSCAHSQPLNCNLKGRAFWWLFARLAGWEGAPMGGELALQTGTVSVTWHSLCTGNVYMVQHSTNLGSGWNDVEAFTNEGFETEWSSTAPTDSPFNAYRLKRE